MKHPWANTVLLVLLAAELASGCAGLVTGAGRLAWILWLHSIGAYAILLALVWKGRIIAGVLAKRRLSGPRLAFLGMTGLTLIVLGAGLLWTFAGQRGTFGFSLMTIHAVLGLVLAAWLVWHIAARRFIFRVRPATDRRAFLRLAGLSLGGLILWQLARSARSTLALPGAAARFTGSYAVPPAPAAFPAVSWLFDDPAPISGSAWRLTIEGVVQQPLHLTYADLAAQATDRLEAILDCTGGWYAEREWRGVNLGPLLAACGPRAGALSITVAAVSGYSRRFALSDAYSFLLALTVDGRLLDHAHGYPARLVAPGYRGFAWVKWVQRISIDETSALLQPPVPLQ